MAYERKPVFSSGAPLPAHSLEILRLLRDREGMLCTGSCHSQKPGQLHCRHIGKELEIGFSVVWKRINYLIGQNLVAREKTGDGPVKFVVTPKGGELLDA